MAGGKSASSTAALDLAGTSGTSTPRGAELAEAFTDEEKARVLRRHLVSADERSNRQSPVDPEFGLSGASSESETRGPSQDSPVTGQPDTASSGGSGGQNGYGAVDDTPQFPIPYDAPGGDVT